MIEDERGDVIVERETRGPGVGAIVAIIVLILVILVLLFGGWRWMSGTSNTTNIQAPAANSVPSSSTGSGTSSSTGTSSSQK